MEINIESKFLLKLHRVADESGTSFDGIVNSAIGSFLNRIPDSSLEGLTEKERSADTLADMMVQSRNKKLRIGTK